jgi:hypothetical protein
VGNALKTGVIFLGVGIGLMAGVQAGGTRPHGLGAGTPSRRDRAGIPGLLVNQRPFRMGGGAGARARTLAGLHPLCRRGHRWWCRRTVPIGVWSGDCTV